VGGTRGTHWRGQESVQGFGGKKTKERHHLEDRGVSGGWDRNGS
jgi:hypothetical protein